MKWQPGRKLRRWLTRPADIQVVDEAELADELELAHDLDRMNWELEQILREGGQ